MAALRLVLSLACAAALGCGEERPVAPSAAAPAAPVLPAPARREPEVTIQFDGQAVSKVVEVIAAVSGRAIECAPGVEGLIDLHVESMPWREALEHAARAAGARVVELDGPRWRVEPLAR